jgi:hypothetical protein
VAGSCEYCHKHLGSNFLYWLMLSLLPDKVDFFNLPNPSSRTMPLGSSQPQTEMSTRNLPGGKGGRPACRADLTTICEPTV